MIIWFSYYFALYILSPSHLHSVQAAKQPVTELQDTIFFRNPGFEGTPGESIIPQEWYSNTPESTPDVFPGAWGLSSTVHEGKTCLGLVIREDKSTEDISQALTQPLKANECYEFTVWLAHLPKYRGYNYPCQLRIYGSNSQNSREKLLASSKLISSTEWAQHRIQFVTKSQVKNLTFVAWYGPGMTLKYKGNILIDDLGPILRCDRA